MGERVYPPNDFYWAACDAVGPGEEARQMAIDMAEYEQKRQWERDQAEREDLQQQEMVTDE
jgi:hypothetical protein